jgi:hypothetical protein
MAMDYIPIQASSVPCERIFSSSAETTTKRRNRISPVLMEALQMLKFQLKQERLNFTDSWMIKEQQLVEDDPDDDLLHMLVSATNHQDGIDRIIQALNLDDE